jgi:hypothetical protein
MDNNNNPFLAPGMFEEDEEEKRKREEEERLRREQELDLEATQVPEPEVAPVSQPSNPFLSPDMFVEPTQTTLEIGNVRGYIQEVYGDKALNEEDILGDENLMNVIRTNLRTRFNDRNWIQNKSTWLGGGATADYVDSLSDEETLDMWQNYQRSFAAGQSVTTLNEFGYIQKADDERKAVLKDGYDLFDSMGNIYSRGDGFWEAADGTWDYIRSAVWDPTTLISFGVGRSFSSGGAKAAAAALKASQKAGTKLAGQQAAHVLTKEAAEQMAKYTTKKSFAELGKQAVQYGAIDAIAAVGADTLYQRGKMEVGSQENFSIGQAALSGIGIAVLPALGATGKISKKTLQKLSDKVPGLKRAVQNYEGVMKATWGKNMDFITNAVKEKTDVKVIGEHVSAAFKAFNDHPFIKSWEGAKDIAADQLEEIGMNEIMLRNTNDFFRTLVWGGPDGSGGFTKGLAEALDDAGFVHHRRFEGDIVTNWFGDIISWMDDKVIRDAVTTFEKTTGSSLGFNMNADLPNQVASLYKARNSMIGLAMSDISKLAGKVSPDGVAARALLETKEMGGALGAGTKATDEAAKHAAEIGRYAQSVWKRLLTSHFGTTGANIQGWAAMYTMNGVSDAVLGATEMTRGLLTGNKELRSKGYETILSSGRRFVNILDPNTQADEARYLLSSLAAEKANKELTEQLAGDAGIINAAERFHMGDGKIVSGLEKITNAAQTITGVKLQDEITKQISFVSAVDREIARAYGMSYTEFFQKFGDQAAVEMATDKFQMVLKKAGNRVGIETASKTWTGGPARSISRGFAKQIENLSNNSVFGYAIPFGRFFNTTVAVASDFSGINAIRHAAKKYVPVMGGVIDPAEEELGDLIAKAMVGWGVVLAMSDEAVVKIEEGLSWNQIRDGWFNEKRPTIADETYDYPTSHARALAQILGHIRHEAKAQGVGVLELDWGKAVPEELKAEVMALFVGQTFRGAGEGLQVVQDMIQQGLGMDFAGAGATLVDNAGSMVGKVVSGATRPLEPLNEIAAMIRGGQGNPDRRQGNELLNKAMRYIDQFPLIGQAPNLPERNTPTRSAGDKPPDYGRIMMGARGSPEPNNVERALASVGRAYWLAVPEFGFEGPPEMKNRMDEVFDRVANFRISQMLDQHPNFSKYTLEERQTLVDAALKNAKRQVKDMIRESVFDEGDSRIGLMHDIYASSTEERLQEALDHFGYEDDIATMNEAQLETLLYAVKNWDKIFPPIE